MRAGGEAAAPGVGPGRLRAAGCERSWAEERELGGYWHPGGLFYGGRLVSGSDGAFPPGTPAGLDEEPRRRHLRADTPQYSRDTSHHPG